MLENNFHKILSNTASAQEKLDFYTSLENDPELQVEFYRYKNLYTISTLNTEKYRDQQNKSFVSFWSKVHSGQSPKIIRIWMRYAAIFILASVLGFMGNYLMNSGTSIKENHRIVYSSEKGSVSTIKMEDGSSIWLSSGTNLVLDKKASGEMVAQLDGEAYFDLIPDPQRNFKVDLGNFQVRDIGTSFNIRAYQSEQLIATTLVKGSIDLVKTSGESILTVKPGEMVKYDKTQKEMIVSQQDPSIVTAWKDGKFVFINQPLSAICKELENWYNVEIQIEDPKLATFLYTGVIKRSTTVKMVLEILALTDQIKYTITDKKEGKDLIRIRK